MEEVYKPVIGLYHHIIKKRDNRIVKILKFNKYIIKYTYNEVPVSFNLDCFSDYTKYKKVYRLLYGV